MTDLEVFRYLYEVMTDNSTVLCNASRRKGCLTFCAEQQNSVYASITMHWKFLLSPAPGFSEVKNRLGCH